jgi:hypothetical protein
MCSVEEVTKINVLRAAEGESKHTVTLKFGKYQN